MKYTPINAKYYYDKLLNHVEAERLYNVYFIHLQFSQKNQMKLKFSFGCIRIQNFHETQHAMFESAQT